MKSLSSYSCVLLLACADLFSGCSHTRVLLKEPELIQSISRPVLLAHRIGYQAEHKGPRFSIPISRIVRIETQLISPVEVEMNSFDECRAVAESLGLNPLLEPSEFLKVCDSLGLLMPGQTSQEPFDITGLCSVAEALGFDGILVVYFDVQLIEGDGEQNLYTQTIAYPKFEGILVSVPKARVVWHASAKSKHTDFDAPEQVFKFWVRDALLELFSTLR